MPQFEDCVSLEVFSSFFVFRQLTVLQRLGIRQNHIESIVRLSNKVAATLHELELYENKIEKIENLDHLINLRQGAFRFRRVVSNHAFQFS